MAPVVRTGRDGRSVELVIRHFTIYIYVHKCTYIQYKVMASCYRPSAPGATIIRGANTSIDGSPSLISDTNCPCTYTYWEEKPLRQQQHGTPATVEAGMPGDLGSGLHQATFGRRRPASATPVGSGILCHDGIKTRDGISFGNAPTLPTVVMILPTYSSFTHVQMGKVWRALGLRLNTEVDGLARMAGNIHALYICTYMGKHPRQQRAMRGDSPCKHLPMYVHDARVRHSTRRSPLADTHA